MSTQYHIDDGWVYTRPAGRKVQTRRAPVVVFSDFYCEYCRRGASTIEKFATDNSSSISFQFRYYATRGPAFNAAVVAECAQALGRGSEMRALLFKDIAYLERHGAAATAALAGIVVDSTNFATCMTGGEARRRVANDFDHARELGITATPTIVVGKTVFLGNPGKSALDSALKQFDSAAR